jgi:hypothetical protein
MGLLLLLFLSCSGSPAVNNNIHGGYRPAFRIGDQVFIMGGEYAQLAGTVIEVDMDADIYRVRLSDNPNPVYVRSYLLRKYEGGAAAAPSRITSSLPAAPPAAPAVAAPVLQVESAPPPVTPAPPAPVRLEPKRLAVLPVIGIDEYLAETVAWHLANEGVINSNFNVVPITPQIRKNVVSEESYSAIYNAGEDIQADYIMASFARRVGCENVFIMVVLNSKTREQLAGDFRKYLDVQEIPALFPAMTKKIINVMRKKNGGAPKLSIELMATPPGSAFKNDAAVLTQLFAIVMANANIYSIFPRTENIDAVILDYETLRTSARKIFVNKDSVTAAQFVLSSKIDVFNSQNQVLAEIIDIGNNVLRRGAYINFDIIEDVPDLLGRLSSGLLTSVKTE